MLDGVTVDQLRTFVEAADRGSFSAAGRHLLRAQSAVSEMVRKLEDQLGVPLFDRRGRLPVLTAEGQLLLADARAILDDLGAMRARAKGMAAGVEAQLTIVVDAMYPIDRITAAAGAFRSTFPNVPLSLFVEALGNSFQPLIDGRASLGIVGPPPVGISGLTLEPLGGIPVVMVAARDHALARQQGVIDRAELRHHVQLVLTDRSSLTEGSDVHVLAKTSWRLADLFVKRRFLLAGLGWGGMPLHAVAADLASGELVELRIEGFPDGGQMRPAFVAYGAESPPGPAGRWLIDTIAKA